MISFDMRGKKALVTGGASGIGLAVTELFLKAGATVAVNYLPSDVRAEHTIHDLVAKGSKIVPAPGDVSQQASTDAMVGNAIERLHGLDFLINNAGTPGTPDPIDFSDLDAMSEPLWDRILATNLVGPFRCTRAAAIALRASKGAVVNKIQWFRLRGLGSDPITGSVGQRVGLGPIRIQPSTRSNAGCPRTGFIRRYFLAFFSSGASGFDLRMLPMPAA